MDRGRMRSWRALAAVLSDEDIADLLVYYATPTVSSGAVQPDLLERGEQLYRFGDSEKGHQCLCSVSWSNRSGFGLSCFPISEGPVGRIF